MTRPRILEIAEGDTEAITFVVENDGRPVTLTGATITITVQKVDQWLGDTWDVGTTADTSPNATKKVDAASVTPHANQTTNKGYCTWSPTAANVDTPGRYYHQLEITDASGKVTHVPKRITDGRMIIHPSL